MPSGPTLADLLELRADDSGSTDFLRMPGRTYGYAEFNEECNRLAHGLVQLGVESADMVTVMLPNRPEYVLTWFAISKLGAIQAPINTALRGPGLSNIWSLLPSRVAVVDAAYLPLLAGLEQLADCVETVVVCGDPGDTDLELPRVKCVAFENLLTDVVTNPARSIRDTAVALLQFTSGSTGRSKPCVLSHRFVVREAELFVQHWELRGDDVLYTPFPLFHADGTNLTIIPALLLKSTAAVGTRFSVSRFWSEVREFGATVFDFMGATLAMLHNAPPSSDDRDNPARLAWGAPIPAIADEFEERFGLRLVEMYGQTDSGVSIYQPLHEPRRPGSCGKAVYPYEIRVVDDDDEVLGPDEVGELVLRSAEPHMLLAEYYGMPEETVRAFRNLWFHTGDLVSIDRDGYVYFAGRKSDYIRRRGENIAAEDVEAVLLGHPGVLDAAVIGVPSELTEEEVAAWIVRRDGALVTAESVWAHCQELLAEFMIPRLIVFAESLPRTPTEKVEKYRLRQLGVPDGAADRAAR